MADPREAALAAAPTQPWRPGGKVPRNVYAQPGPGADRRAPIDGGDTDIGRFDTAALAERACDDHNARLGVEAGPVTHRIAVTIDQGGGLPRIEFACHQPEGAFCRQTCSLPYCEGEPHGDEPHQWVDSGECLAAVWLNEGGEGLESYDGPDDTDLRPGPIEVAWNGEDWTWRYPEREATHG